MRQASLQTPTVSTIDSSPLVNEENGNPLQNLRVTLGLGKEHKRRLRVQ